MKKLILFLVLGYVMNCSSPKNPGNWDAGAQRQEAIEEEGRQEQIKSTQEQFPDATEIYNRPQPF